MENRKRNVHLHVMVTPDELAAIHERMTEAGISNAGACLPSFAVWTASGGGLPSLGAGRRQIRSVPVSGKLSSLGPYWPEIGAV